MPLSSIVVIVIRLFAVNWLVTGASLLASAATNPLPHERQSFAVLIPYALPVLFFVFAAGSWILAPFIGRLVSRGVDANVSVGSLSRSDLYSFAFVFLGLFFILSSVADVINWILYFTVSGEALRPHPVIQGLYQINLTCLRLEAGVVSLLGPLVVA